MDPADFVQHNTAIVAPPLVPEIRLHLATEVAPIWLATEETLAQGAVPPPYWAFAWAGGQALARYLLDHPETVAGRAHVPGDGLCELARYDVPTSHELEGRERCDGFVWRVLPR